MTKYNHYARELDTALKQARQDYQEAWAALQAAKDDRDKAPAGSLKARLGIVMYNQAEVDFKEAERNIWETFNRRRAELRAELAKEVREENRANPDSVDSNGVELMKSGVLDVDDFFSLARQYESNATMLRLMVPYIEDLADTMDNTRAKDRASLHYLARECSQAQGRVMQSWDALSKIADYCSGQSRERRDNPIHTISMGKWWEKLSAEAVENF